MASFSSATRELVLKLVYYGPGLGGKTTTLKALHASVRTEHRGKMVSLATPVDRTLYFDFLPVRLPSVGEMQLRLQLFTVPGQVYFNATRKLVLTGADGIVFVADSQAARLDANTESLNNLRDNLGEMGRPIESVPVVLAYNKRDLPDVLSVEELDRELNPHGFPSLATSAATGKGVFESLDAVVRVALDDLRRRRVIPSDVEVPGDGIVMERLADVRLPVPAPVSEPMRVVSEEPRRSASMTMPAILSTDSRSTPAFPFAVPAAPEPVRAAPAASSSSTASRTASESLASAALAATEVYSETLAPNSVPALKAESLARPVANASAAPVTDASARSGSGSSTQLRRHSLFAPLFPSEDQDTLRNIEEALGESILPRAALLLEALMVRVIERAARSLGREGAPHESIAWVLQIPSDRYGRLRTAAQRARRGGEIARRDVLEGYLAVALAQTAADALSAR